MTFRWDNPITWLSKQGSEDKPGWVYGAPSHFVLGDLEDGQDLNLRQSGVCWVSVMPACAAMINVCDWALECRSCECKRER